MQSSNSSTGSSIDSTPLVYQRTIDTRAPNAKIFLTETPKVSDISFDTAFSFGNEIRLIFDKRQRTQPSPFKTHEYISKVIHILSKQDFDEKRDYFILFGSVLQVCLVQFAILTQWSSINVLMYSSSEEKYANRRLEV